MASWSSGRPFSPYVNCGPSRGWIQPVRVGRCGSGCLGTQRLPGSLRLDRAAEANPGHLSPERLYDGLDEMFGDVLGRVKSLRPFSLHGLTYWDIAVELDDGRIEEARLGAEGVPEGLQPGDRVLVRRAAMMIIGLERELEGK